MKQKSVAVVGAAETTKMGRIPDVSVIGLHADAALNAYLKLKGQKQGEIKGSVTQKGREGAIAVIAVSERGTM